MNLLFWRIALFCSSTFWERLYMKSYIKVCQLQGLRLGEDVKIFERVNFGSEPFLIEIGDKTQIAGGTRFVSHGGTTKTLRRLKGFEDARIFGRIKIGKNCTIGNNCVIQQHVEIGDNCILGASSVLTHSIPDNSVFSGNPARFICSIEQYAESILDQNTLYPRELENDKKQLNKWLKNNLPYEYKKAVVFKKRQSSEVL
ncbi:acyltransferase [Chryseobacterium nematophagum]|uniref:Acyltransferase n=1 Tax=Chryseobacterium nematophagum TaxID=2305228 RepID=A0A3M7TFV0_9FLAO|nr:acyltransferase [Chryseobacterium nematophagum]RNA61090.1 acyltransferase [Chryseobacterium nematophagum]